MQKIIDYIKTHRWAYNMFYYIGTFAIRFFSIFIRIDNKKVLFVSFGGKKFDDSPKAIYQQMCEDKFFDDYNFVWAFRNPETFDIGARGVKIK
ncbi:MAG: CDP-glycerol glycerophosphotransferase family protein, partial [Clostridia bacterium]